MADPTSTRLVVITGLSGAGRRTASHTLEDLGWYVVDNLPPVLLPQLIETAQRQEITQIATVIDVRTRESFNDVPATFAALQDMGIHPQVLFIEAADDVIVRRQESVRRPLPLQGDGPLLDGIRRERHMLSVLRASADVVIDTSQLNVHQLKARVAYAFDAEEDRSLHITLMSFGFKNGAPIDADMVFDVRFLPNPYWVPELRPKTGLSEEVSSYVLGFDEAQRWADEVEGLLAVVAPGYVREGKRLATVAIGCTGGKHRSTAMVEETARRLRARGIACSTLHRDLGRE